MMKIAVWAGGLTDSYLRQVTQLGADCIDFGGGQDFPGVTEPIQIWMKPSKSESESVLGGLTSTV